MIYRIVSRQVFRQQLVDRAGKRIYEQLHPVIEAPVLARPTAAMMTSAGVSSAQAAQTAAELDQCYRPAYRRQNNRERFTAEQAARAWQQLVHSLDNLISTPLPEDWPRHNAGLYQAAFFRALVFHAPKQSLTIRRQTICATLGAKKSSIHDLVRRAGLEAEPQTRTVPLQGHQDIRQEVSQTGRTIQGYPTCVVLQTADGTITIRRPYDAALSPKVIRQERAAGRVVSIVYQLASAYHIAREVFQPLPKKPVESSHSGGHAPRAPRKDSRPKPYYGPGYNPAWLVRQFEWAARLMGLYWEQGLVDPRTGEVVAFETLLNMLAVFLGHAVPTDASSDAADDDPAGTERSG
ncbi:MAG: hypothetical protein K8J31_11150 [Anaerolineae bacterium]|nr:hypothetical protein [Anaerolineae bacterium]